MEHLSNDHKDHELSTKIVISYTIKRGILLGHTVLSLTKVSQWRETIVEQIQRQKNKKSKRTGL